METVVVIRKNRNEFILYKYKDDDDVVGDVREVMLPAAVVALNK